VCTDFDRVVEVGGLDDSLTLLQKLEGAALIDWDAWLGSKLLRWTHVIQGMLIAVWQLRPSISCWRACSPCTVACEGQAPVL